MTLQQLKYVHAVAAEGHFGRAAIRCRVAQPTLSMQLKKLEQELGSVLFDRSTQPIQLTEVGQHVHATAQRILDELGGLSDLMAGTTERMDGLLRLAVLPTLAPTVLPRLMPALVDRCPDLEVRVLERTTADMVRDLHNGDIDVGILVTPLSDNKLRYEPTFMEPMLAYLHPNHTASSIPSGQLATSDLPIESMLLLEEGHCFRSQVLQLCRAPERGANLGFKCESGSIETLKRLVRQSGGCTLIPGLEALENPQDPCVRQFADPQPAREVSLVVRPNYHREALLHELRDTLRSVVPKTYHTSPSYRRIPWEASRA